MDRTTAEFPCSATQARNARYGRNAMNATDGTDPTTDEATASDRPFDTPSFIINIKLLGVCFFLI